MVNQTFNPDIVLDYAEQSALAATAATPGYKVMHRIFRSEVDKFILHLINANASDERDVLSRHYLAKSAAQFYHGVTARINEEVTQYTNGEKPNQVQQDATEGLLDIGERASTFDDLDEDLFLGEGTE